CQNSGPFSGSGSNGQSGTNCLAIYSFPVISGNMYRISTCDSFSGDTYLKTNGACVCYPNRVNDDFCGSGSECDCYATSTGMGTICASTFSSASAAWNYKVTCLPN
ncbi:MAG TPA: hypothetical protein VLK22_01580, partial [Candidatus Udaeobacter sp.]|nr:hypothetical protein [Candidatus Udaeobacter sp.]